MSTEDEAMQMLFQNFDAESFLEISYTEAMDTARVPLPSGEVPVEAITEVKLIPPKLYTSKEGEQRYMNPQLNIKCRIADEAIREQMNAREGQDLVHGHRVWLDITPEGLLDTGGNRNIALGQLRAALGQNIPGTPWQPQDMVEAGGFIMFCQHDQDPRDATRVYDRITKYIPLPEEE